MGIILGTYRLYFNPTNKIRAFINSKINFLDINDILDLNLNEQKREIYQKKKWIRHWEGVGMKQI
jgi:1-deoxy-D-xylulose 5-phosphate reductoisomerase